MKRLAFFLYIAVFACISAAGGTFRDSRNGKTYRTVVIGGKTWMAENLNIKTEGSWCYDNDESNCEKYGRLYDWNAAKSVCPEGWHLPSREEWGDLAKAAGGSGKYGDEGGAGKKLKSKAGWNSYTVNALTYSGNGSDEFGFLALPGGTRYINGFFYSAGLSGNWWTATENDAGYYAYRRSMYYSNDSVDELNLSKDIGHSVRCSGD
jgi:uncharacterized protein (TIGR02145 family)